MVKLTDYFCNKLINDLNYFAKNLNRHLPLPTMKAEDYAYRLGKK
jgi:hypothetical protein